MFYQIVLPKSKCSTSWFHLKLIYMKNNNVRLVYDRKKKSASKGTGEVELYIYLSRSEKTYLHLTRLKPDEYYAYQMSKEAKEKIEKCNRIIEEMAHRNEPMTVKVFSSKFLSFDMTSLIPKSFIDFVSESIDTEEIKSGTRKHKKVTLDAIMRFGKFRTFDDLTEDNIRAFDRWLHEEGNRSDATVHNYHKHLMKWTRLAFEQHHIQDDPYRRLHFSRGKSKERNPLSEKELVKLRKLPLIGHLAHARDLFIFSAYTGLSYVDVCAFDYETMTESIDGKVYIDGSRLKTGNKFFTPILAPAMEVLQRNNYKLRLLSNQKVNDYLHTLEPRIKTTKSISFHVARHSFATLCLSHEIPIENVARMMGHSDIKTTQIYAKILKSTIARHSAHLAASIL